MKLNKAGWLAVAIVAVLVVSGLFLAGRDAWTRLRGLGGLQPVPVVEYVEHTPGVEQPSAVVTATPALDVDVMVKPTPDGWTYERDPFTGNDYLAPPSEVEAQVREAFAAALALLIVEDRPNEAALEYALTHSREDELERLEELAAPAVVDRYREQISIALGSLGPENPVRCESYYRCTVGRVKLEAYGGMILYDEASCTTLSEGIPPETQTGNFLASADGTRCVTRFVKDDVRRAIYVGVVDRQADGVWRLTDFGKDPIN